jgi:glyoxylase-like metal-dependent hydrolase (beta-lactamase superfamily II)
VDTGLPRAEDRILSWAAHTFGPSKPAAIILTHGHFDHAGSAVELASHWNVPVFAHPLEHPYLNGTAPYPPPDPTVGGGIMSLMSRLFPRDPVDLTEWLEPLPPDGSVPGLRDWRWLHTPGHTSGHISLFRESDWLLLAGDAFVTTKQESFLAVATQRPELHGPPAYFTTDWDAARESVESLAALQPSIVATGHGLPLSGAEVAPALEALAANFDTVARPAHGRYVDSPTL